MCRRSYFSTGCRCVRMTAEAVDRYGSGFAYRSSAVGEPANSAVL